MNLANKRLRDDRAEHLEPSAKRVQANEWKREKIEVGCRVDLSRPIFFTDTTLTEYQDSNRLGSTKNKLYRMGQTLRFHANGEPMSACYQYVLWLNPSIPPEDRVSVHSHYRDIESWSNFFGQYFFRRGPFNFLQLPSDFQTMALQGYLTPADMVKARPTHGVFRSQRPQACETVRFDLSDPQLEEHIATWKTECDTARFRIGKAIVEGPLALQEKSIDDDDRHAKKRYQILVEILASADVITFKSVEATDLGNAYSVLSTARRKHLRPKSVHVEELRVGLNTYRDGAERFRSLARMFQDHVLQADRWVYGIRGESTESLRDTLADQQTIFPIDRPIYIAVDTTNDEVLFAIENLGVRNYVVPNRFRDSPHEAVRALLSGAEHVIYRPFNEDLMAVDGGKYDYSYGL
jgi:hypothetical protein